MFTRDELSAKSLQELQQLGRNLGVSPIGNPNSPGAWIVPLFAVGTMAMDDCDKGLGLRRFPDARAASKVEDVLDMLGQPTPHQKILIKAALQGIWMQRVDERAVQQRILEIWIARTSLLEALVVLR